MASKISSALPAHLKPAALSSSNGNADGAFERKHHGKTQSHMVSHIPAVCGDVVSWARSGLKLPMCTGSHVLAENNPLCILLFHTTMARGERH